MRRPVSVELTDPSRICYTILDYSGKAFSCVSFAERGV